VIEEARERSKPSTQSRAIFSESARLPLICVLPGRPTAVAIVVDDRSIFLVYLVVISSAFEELLPPNSRFSLTRVCYPFFRDFWNSRLFDDLGYHQFRDYFFS